MWKFNWRNIIYNRLYGKYKWRWFFQVLCYNSFDAKTVNLIKKLISRRYFTNWIVDKLTSELIVYNPETKKASLKNFNGIPLGYHSDCVFYIYNHYQFHILLNKIDEDRYNVVGFNNLPMTIKHNQEEAVCVKESKDILDNLEKSLATISRRKYSISYDVIFEFSEFTLASRLDHYKTARAGIHWSGIILSEVLIVVISMCCFM